MVQFLIFSYTTRNERHQLIRYDEMTEKIEKITGIKRMNIRELGAKLLELRFMLVGSQLNTNFNNKELP